MAAKPGKRGSSRQRAACLRGGHCRQRGFLLLAGALVCSLLLTVPAAATSQLSFAAGPCDSARTVWDRTRAKRGRAAHCAELSLALASLRSAPEKSLTHALRALELLPSSARASLVVSHARLLLGDRRKALVGYALLQKVYEQEVAEHRREVVAKWGVVDWLLAARAALIEGQWELARERYRRVALDLESLGSERLAARALVEAATAALHAGERAELEAEGYLEEAARRVAPTVRPWVQLARMLARREGTLALRGTFPELSERALSTLAREARAPSLTGSVPLLPEAELQLWLAVSYRQRDESAARLHGERLLSAKRPPHLRDFDRAVIPK